MSYPMAKNLVPLAEQHIADSGKKVLSNGNVTVGKRGLKRIVWKSVYDYGITLWTGKLIVRKSGRYKFAESLVLYLQNRGYIIYRIDEQWLNEGGWLKTELADVHNKISEHRERKP